MKLLLWLCLVLYFKATFSQINCYKCPTNSLITKEYFRTHNCSFLQDRRSYICCVDTTALFSCKIRRKRANLDFFLQSYPPSPTINHFPINPLDNEQHNSFHQIEFDNFGPQNNPQFQHSNTYFSSNNYLNNIPQPPDSFIQQSSPHFQQNTFFEHTKIPQPSDSFVQQRNSHFQQNTPFGRTNNFYSQHRSTFGQQNIPQFPLNQPHRPLNYNLNTFVPPSSDFTHQNSPPFQPNPFSNIYRPTNGINSTFNKGLHTFPFDTSEPPTNKVSAEQSSQSEYFHVYPTSDTKDIKVTPIKRSVHKSENISITDIHQHENFDLLPLKTICGIQENADRIFGGEEASIGEFPWMSLLEYNFKGRNIGFKCGGILINDRYVLTAAHCIAGKTITPQENLFSVRLGDHDIQSEIDCDSKTDCNDPPLNVEVEEVVLHHNYHEMDRNIHNDIALIRLNRKILYTDFVRPICLPLHEQRPNPGQNMTIAGWGTKLEDVPSNEKQKATIPYTNDSKCKELWKDVVQIINSQFCAGGKSRTNVCKGDSGGPIMSTFPESGHWFVEGIVSFGKTPCGGEPFPSVYTRVSNYITWILDNIKA